MTFTRSAALCAALTCLAASPGWAYDPRLPVLGGEPDAAAKLARFRARHPGDAAVEAALAQAQADGVPRRDWIHAALLAQRRDYAACYAAFERGGTNATDWAAPLEALPPEAEFARAHATYLYGRSLAALEDLPGAAEAFEAVRSRWRLVCPWTDEATLYLGQLYARLPARSETLAAANRSRAQRLLRTLADGRFPDAPARVREGAAWLLRELDGQGSGPLLELARQMGVIERLIQQSHTGDDTQGRQDQVVATLDRLIELMRERESGGG